jgi:hypothetical protein
MREAQSPSADWAPLKADPEPRSWPGIALSFSRLADCRNGSGFGADPHTAVRLRRLEICLAPIAGALEHPFH